MISFVHNAMEDQSLVGMSGGSTTREPVLSYAFLIGMQVFDKLDRGPIVKVTQGRLSRVV